LNILDLRIIKGGENMWEVTKISKRRELQRRRYYDEVEWVEVHNKRSSRCKLRKYRERDKEKTNDGFSYCLTLEGEEILYWADDHWQDFDSVERDCCGMYLSNSLDSLTQFLEESKKQAYSKL
jgi:hypothetical protein